VTEKSVPQIRITTLELEESSPCSFEFGSLHSKRESGAILESDADESNEFGPFTNINDADVFCSCIQHIGPYGFHWQQENAPAHGPGGEVIREWFNMVNWPPDRQDLSPIEMIWSIIKRKLKGKRYKCDYDLFAVIEEVWYEIPQNEIEQLV
jgi:hypothetical protein